MVVGTPLDSYLVPQWYMAEAAVEQPTEVENEISPICILVEIYFQL